MSFDYYSDNMRENIKHSLAMYISGLISNTNYQERYKRKVEVEIYKYIENTAKAPSVSIHLGDSKPARGDTGIDNYHIYKCMMQIKGVEIMGKREADNASKTDLAAIILSDLQHSRKRARHGRIIPLWKGNIDVKTKEEKFRQTGESIAVEYVRTEASTEARDTQNVLYIHVRITA